MTLDGLRAFCAVIESGSFRGAATRIHRSQPAISQQIKMLEAELGHVLIERRTSAPTPVGRRLYDRARQMLLDAESLEKEMADLDDEKGGELRIGSSDTTALYLLPEAVRAFRLRMPGVLLTLVSRPTEAITKYVCEGSLDLGVVTLPIEGEPLESIELIEQRFVLVFPRRHRLAGRSRIRLEDLGDETFLMLDGSTRTGALLRRFFQRSDFQPRIGLDSGSFEVIKRYVAEGIGISILPETVIGKADRALKAVAMAGLPRTTIGTVWRRGAYRNVAHRTFVELLEKALRGIQSPLS